MIRKQEFLEYADVFGDFKGTSKSWVEDKLKNEWNVILELDWQGAKQVKEIYPNAETIFILPPSYAELQLRLNARGLDKKEEIKKRLGEAKKEVKNGVKRGAKIGAKKAMLMAVVFILFSFWSYSEECSVACKRP